jgi:hypothetical protein
MPDLSEFISNASANVAALFRAVSAIKMRAPWSKASYAVVNDITSLPYNMRQAVKALRSLVNKLSGGEPTELLKFFHKKRKKRKL